MKRQYVTGKFRPGDTRIYTWHNDREPVAAGDRIVIPGKAGPLVIDVDSVYYEPTPPYETKPIVGKEFVPTLTTQKD
jgi:hypothetical protein